jgi:hypothetical protein
VTDRVLPRYPVYIPSKGRAKSCLTARFFAADGVPFHVVVEPQEADAYAAEFGRERILVLPFRDRGSVIPARNWIKEHATKSGALRHWQFDDNIRGMRRWYGKRIPCSAGPALRALEDFADRYENVAIAGFNYTMFCAPSEKVPPFFLNVHVYSATLILNSIRHEWRGRYNEDTDICLQVLADGWCTVLFNAFMVDKAWTMKIKGGNTTELYQGDGRLKMARALERAWPHVVEVDRRFQRPQHVVRDSWKKFDTPLRRRSDVDWGKLEGTHDEFGLELRQVAPAIKSDAVRRIYEEKRSVAGARDPRVSSEETTRGSAAA